jgi:hypothetical protein
LEPRKPWPFTTFSFTDAAGRPFRAGLVEKGSHTDELRKTVRGGLMDLQCYVVKLDGVVGGTPRYGLLADRLVLHRSVDEGRSKVPPTGKGEVVKPIRLAPQTKGK